MQLPPLPPQNCVPVPRPKDKLKTTSIKMEQNLEIHSDGMRVKPTHFFQNGGINVAQSVNQERLKKYKKWTADFGKDGSEA